MLFEVFSEILQICIENGGSSEKNSKGEQKLGDLNY